MTDEIKAGAAIVDITPPRGLGLGGYPRYPRYNTGAHDPLYASCLYIESQCGETNIIDAIDSGIKGSGISGCEEADSGAAKCVKTDSSFTECVKTSSGFAERVSSAGGAVAIIGVDLLFISRKNALDIRRAAAALTGMDANNIMICCSHSHSSPSCAGLVDEGAGGGVADSTMDGATDYPSSGGKSSQDRHENNSLAGDGLYKQYLNELKIKLASLAASAQRNAEECRAGFGRAMCGPELGIGGNRRDPANGPNDPFVYVIGIKDMAGVIRCLLVNYAVHPTILHEDNTLCSADYPGYIRARLRELYPHAITVFTLGAAGDQSTRYFRRGQSFVEAERFGRAIGGAAALAADAAEYNSEPAAGQASQAVYARQAEYNPKLRELPKYDDAVAVYKEKQAAYERLKSGGAPYALVQDANVKRLGAEHVVKLAETVKNGGALPLINDELPSEASLFTIGDIKILGLPGEVFAGVAISIRKRFASEKLIVATVTNGCLPGYVYTAEEAEYGGYEVETSMLDISAATALERAAASMLDATVAEPPENKAVT